MSTVHSAAHASLVAGVYGEDVLDCKSNDSFVSGRVFFCHSADLNMVSQNFFNWDFIPMLLVTLYPRVACRKSLHHSSYVKAMVHIRLQKQEVITINFSGTVLNWQRYNCFCTVDPSLWPASHRALAGIRAALMDGSSLHIQANSLHNCKTYQESRQNLFCYESHPLLCNAFVQPT